MVAAGIRDRLGAKKRAPFAGQHAGNAAARVHGGQTTGQGAAPSRARTPVPAGAVDPASIDQPYRPHQIGGKTDMIHSSAKCGSGPAGKREHGCRDESASPKRAPDQGPRGGER